MLPLARLSLPLATAALVLAAGSRTADAQSAQRWSLQGSALAVMPSGSAYEGLNSGVGVEAQVRYTPSALSWGFGVQYSSHNLDLGTSTESVSLSGPFVEPRYVLDIGRATFAPYVSARLAYLRQHVDVQGISASAGGTQVNIGGGVLLRLSPRLNLDAGATYGMINFGDVVLSSGGQSATVDGSSGSGQNLVLRAGLAIGLGR